MIFISYRKDDAGDLAWALADKLIEIFGQDCVFLDRHQIKPGDHWREEIDAALSKAVVVLAVIGRHWLTCCDEFGKRRIDDDEDVLAYELSVALQRGIIVIPLYLHGLKPLPEKAFPKMLAGLAVTQAIEFDIGRDLPLLLAKFDTIPDLHSSSPKPLPEQFVWEIPSAFSDFTGRNEEIKQVTDSLNNGSTRVVVISGLPGMGKSQLAFQLAGKLKHLFPNGGFFCDLHGYNQTPISAHEAMKRILWSLDPGSTLPEDKEQLANMYRSHFSGRRCLLLFDNARDQSQMEVLIPPEPCVAFITSRCTMQLPTALSIRLAEFVADDSVAFLQKLNSRIRGHEKQVANACGNLPMALRLAASALEQRPYLSVEEYIRLLDDAEARSGFFPSVQVQFDLLTQPMQQQLAALTMFRKGFGVTSVSGVWALSMSDAEKQLIELYNFSLVIYRPEARRFFLHDLVSQFATAHWEKESASKAEPRYAKYYSVVAKGLQENFLAGGEGVIQSLHSWDEHCLDIQAAFSWTCQHSTESQDHATICADLAEACWYFYEIRYSLLNMLPLAQEGLKATQFLQNEKLVCMHLRRLGFIYAHFPVLRPQAEPLFQQALSLSRKLGDRRAEGIIEGYRGLTFEFSNMFEEALAVFEVSLAIAREGSDYRQLGIALGRIGDLHICRKEPIMAIKFFEEAVKVEEQIGDSQGMVIDRTKAGKAYASQGRIYEAAKHLKDAANIALRMEDTTREISALECLVELTYHEEISAFQDSAQQRLGSLFQTREQHGEINLDIAYQLYMTERRWVLASLIADLLIMKTSEKPSGWLLKAEAVRHRQPNGLNLERQILEKGREHFPNEWLFPYNLACNSADSQQNGEALTWFREAIKKSPDPSAIIQKGIVDSDLIPIKGEIAKLLDEDNNTKTQ
jgi:tetratricopeptide (TPR) repeat protein